MAKRQTSSALDTHICSKERDNILGSLGRDSLVHNSSTMTSIGIHGRAHPTTQAGPAPATGANRKGFSSAHLRRLSQPCVSRAIILPLHIPVTPKQHRVLLLLELLFPNDDNDISPTPTDPPAAYDLMLRFPALTHLINLHRRCCEVDRCTTHNQHLQ